MCGIAGICSLERASVEEHRLRRMAGALVHRGPDADGYFLDRQGAPAVGLASRRLAVIDIEGGDQPMSIEDGAFTVIYNGELFNAPDVRRDLEARGHRFRSRCDTEVVVRGYAEWGTDVLHRLNGMWAFAIWDARERRLFLARDRLGVKPLVYADTASGLVFGSEIKALIESGLVDRDLDAGVLPHYLSFFAVPEPHSLIAGVRRLPAGHALTVDASGLTEFQYWDCAAPEEDDRGRQAYREEIAALLEDSVRRRLVSDVSLGVLLSSGLDSSLVAAFAARHHDGPLRTFTLGFGASEADERGPAGKMAGALGAAHVDDQVSATDLKTTLPDLLERYDEPGQSLLQTYFVSRLAARDVTVALSGLGGDELFGAYPAHVAATMLARVDRIPAVLRAPALAAARSLPRGRLKRVVELAAMDPDDRAIDRLMQQTAPSLRAELLASDLREAVDLDAPARHLASHYERAQGEHPLNRMLYVYAKTYLPDELLRAGDAMSMLHSLELRTPFLDYRLVERALSMPATHKLRMRRGKLLLRDIADDVLPLPVPRAKRGFALPLARWVRDDLAEGIRDTLAGPSVRQRGLFEPKRVDRLLDACMRGDDRAIPPVMMLYCFETWARRWLDRQAPLPTAQNGADLRSGDRDLSVIIVNWNTRERLRACLASLERHLVDRDPEVIVVDNDSGDGSAEMLDEHFPAVRLIRNSENVGFGRANNQGMKAASGRWLLLLNSDTELLDDSVTHLCERVERDDEIGVAHCKMTLADGRLQYTAYRFPSLGRALIENLGLYKLMSRDAAGSALLSGYWEPTEERDVDWVAGSFMLLPRAVFEATGGFDERIFMYGEDLEWCYRIRDAGWRIRYYPQAEIRHHDHSSSDIRWGDERVRICLERQRDIYRDRHGRASTVAFMALGVVGGLLRAAYYSIRRLTGPRAPAYADMQRATLFSLRAQLSLILGRR